eukprot:TRINITY_DN2644_c0_g1_i2.p1 TRINITY_DN2644_c0_g1~~TRINITY_DN2644_c0_g1_i2.p1  ORF type:complete len:1250 (-),score=386.92 TRINITY_DN2644_c0_g1_i2:202-3924(-)
MGTGPSKSKKLVGSSKGNHAAQITFEVPEGGPDLAQRLDLSNLNFIEPPPQLILYTSLTWLALSANHMVHLPPQISMLVKLEILRVDSNKLVDLPSELAVLTALTSLDVGKNKLKQLNGEIFNGLTNLKELDLNWNELSTMPLELAKCTHLNKLNLFINKLEDLPIQYGPSLGQCLESLDLAHNKLKELPKVFQHFTKLTNLNLVGNLLLHGGAKSTSTQSIIHLTSLTKLNFTSSSLHSFPGDDGIDKMKNMRILFLRNNEITRIPSAIGSWHDLQQLFIGDNKLASLPKEIGMLRSLKKFYAWNNQITSLPAEFTQLQALIEVDFTSNKFASFPVQFQYLSALGKIHISRNKINSWPVISDSHKAKIHSWSLNELVISYNNLKSIPKEISMYTALGRIDACMNEIDTPLPNLSAMSNLWALELAGNKLGKRKESLNSKDDKHSSTFPIELFSMTLPNLAVLNLCYNEIKGVCPIEQIAKSFPKLAKLYLSYNYFKLAPLPINAQHKPMPCLRELHMSGQDFTEIPPFILSTGITPMLRELNLSNNEIEILPTGISILSQLEALLLNANHISLIEHRSICTLSNLKELDLSWNALKTLPDDFLVKNGEEGNGPVEGANSLADLDLTMNQIMSFPTNVSKIESLRQVKIGHNHPDLCEGNHKFKPGIWVSLQFSMLNKAAAAAGIFNDDSDNIPGLSDHNNNSNSNNSNVKGYNPSPLSTTAPTRPPKPVYTNPNLSHSSSNSTHTNNNDNTNNNNKRLSAKKRSLSSRSLRAEMLVAANANSEENITGDKNSSNNNNSNSNNTTPEKRTKTKHSSGSGIILSTSLQKKKKYTSERQFNPLKKHKHDKNNPDNTSSSPTSSPTSSPSSPSGALLSASANNLSTSPTPSPSKSHKSIKPKIKPSTPSSSSSPSKSSSSSSSSSTTKPAGIVVEFGWAEMKGRRPEQQDTIAVIPNYTGQQNTHYVAVFDGHAGSQASEYACSFLHEKLTQHLFPEIFIDDLIGSDNETNSSSNDGKENNNKENNNKDGTVEFDFYSTAVEDPISALTDTFKHIHNDIDKLGVEDGTAAIVAMMKDNRLFIANAGDSRAILLTKDPSQKPHDGQKLNDGYYKITALSQDHKPEEEKERNRIIDRGGFVTDSKRVNGMLALSRSLGDCELQPWVTWMPDIKEHILTKEDCYVVLACDGVWDVLSNEEVSRLVRESELEGGDEPVKLASKIRDVSYLLGSSDNISVVVIRPYIQ